MSRECALCGQVTDQGGDVQGDWYCQPTCYAVACWTYAGVPRATFSDVLRMAEAFRIAV